MMKLQRLFQPSKIGPLVIPNRIVMVAVTTRYDFEESDRLPRFYAERAKGGVGLIITGRSRLYTPAGNSELAESIYITTAVSQN